MCQNGDGCSLKGGISSWDIRETIFPPKIILLHHLNEIFSIVSPFKNANKKLLQKEIPSRIHHFSLRAVVLGAVSSFYLLFEMHGDFN